jgi:hypothetical protein
MKVMANDSEMMKKWITLTTEDMLNNAKIWKMNQATKNDNDRITEIMSTMDSLMMKGNAIQEFNDNYIFKKTPFFVFIG